MNQIEFIVWDMPFFICVSGSMFSGKTDYLIALLRKAEHAKLKPVLFKPIKDDRNKRDSVKAHSDLKWPAIEITEGEEEKIYELGMQYDVIGVDESQFFNKKIVKICLRLADKGKRVIVTVLNKDRFGVAFPVAMDLMPVVDHCFTVHAICAVCKKPASFSFDKTSNGGDTQVKVGGAEIYEPLCRHCYNLKNE